MCVGGVLKNLTTGIGKRLSDSDTIVIGKYYLELLIEQVNINVVREGGGGGGGWL